MYALRRALSRKEVAFALLLFFLASGWFGWYHMARPVLAQDNLDAAKQTQLADFQSRVDQAIASRAALDAASPVAAITEQVSEIREVLGPIFAALPTQPASPEQAAIWRHALAVLADGQMLAGAAGDAGAEAAALSLMRNSCPADAWACYFQIPEKALAAVRGGTLDDHARIAMLTATGFLYAQAGDRIHCDTLQRKAIQVYGNLLETYDDWGGQPSRTFTPQGRLKAIGTEYYDYRNRMDRLAMYSADFWGMQVVDGSRSMDQALAVCDHKLFRASVRMRADRQTDPIMILHEEGIRELDFSTVADWFMNRAYDPQADWEHERAQLVQQIGDQEVAAVNAIAQARKLAVQKRYDDALVPLEKTLQMEPTLAETGVSLRCEVVSVLMNQHRYEEALNLLDDAEGLLHTGDPRLTASTTGYLQGRIGYYRMQCARGAKDNVLAVEAAEQLIGDTSIPVSFRAHTLLELMQVHIENHDKARALDAFERLAGLPVTPAQAPAMLQPLVEVAQARLAHKGWLAAIPATSGIASPRS